VHDFTISFVVLLNSSYTPVPTNPLLDWAITSYTVTPTVNIDYPGAANPTGNRVIITTTVCTGVTTLASCNANNSGTITSTMNNINDTASYACSFALIVGTCASNQVTFTNPTATVFVNHVIQIDRNGAANTTVGLTNLANSFGETAVAPEPGTVGLMGAALAGLVALRRRRQ
jgi:hypothetical protein